MNASPTSNAGRTALSKKGQTAYGKSYPVPNKAYYKKAVRAIGRAPASKRGVLKAFLRRRAKQLGIKPSPGVMNASNIMLAGSLPVASASDGPRVVSLAGQRLGLQPHQVKAYARFRKRGASHKAAMNFARRVRSRANLMGTAATVGSGTGSRAYTRESTVDLAYRIDTPASNAKGAQLGSSAKANRGKTNQASQFVPQTTPAKRPAGGTKSETASNKTKIARSKVPSLRLQSSTPSGGKLLAQSGGKYSWPDNKGAGRVPATPVSTGAGFKTPTNLVVNSTSSEPGMSRSVRVNASQPGRQAKQAVGKTKQSVAYGKLRSKGISHATAMKVVGQYYGSGKPKNALGTRKGGSMTNLRMKSTGGTAYRAPKA